MTSLHLVLLKTFPTVIEAESALNILKAHGIKAVFQTQQPGMTGYLGNVAGGELYVQSIDLEKAREIVG